jgi:serine/threonine-protein kinase RsbW
MKCPPEFGVDDSALVELAVPNDLRSAKQPEGRILQELDRHGYEPDATFAVKLALEEAITNAVKHGNRNDPTKQIVVRFHIDPDRVIIMVRDDGPGFRPAHVPDPTAEENLERPNGRGIMLMHSYMTRVCYNERGNEVWLFKRRHEAAL